MYCMNCGKEISNEVKFCPYCGSSTGNADSNNNYATESVSSTVEYTTGVDSASVDKTHDKKRKKRRRIVLGIVIAVCAVVVAFFVVIAIFALTSDNVDSGVLMQQDAINDSDSVLGNSQYVPEDILTVTFLDSLDDMPSDAWDVSGVQDGSVMAWVISSTRYGGGYYDLYIAGEGGVYANPDSSNLFNGYTDVESIDFNDCFYTDDVTDMGCMFADCWDLKELDLSGWDTGNAKNMSSMFYYCYSLEKLDVSGWDTGNVTDMSWMVFDCESLRTLDVSGWDTGNVTNMCGMFDYCYSLEELDVTGWNTGNVTDMSWMFEDCESLEELDLSGWDTSRADTSYMFDGTIWE